MLKLRSLHCALLLIFGTADVAYAQQVSQRSVWVSAGLGEAHLPSGMAAIGYEFGGKPTLLTARFVTNREILSNEQPSLKTNELGLLYGLRRGKFRFSTGLSGVWGIKRGTYLTSDPDPLTYGSSYYEPVRYWAIGLPGEVRFITSLKQIGLGITGFGNWNAARSFAGLNLSFYVGRMN